MTDFCFHCPIEVRYADLDPQGHVNNAVFLTYFEQARARYLIRLGISDNDQSFLNVGIILADARVTFLSPVFWGMDLRVGARVSRVGTKSIMMEYELIDDATQTRLATGATVLVAFDYRTRKSIPVPEAWRKQIYEFESL